MFKNFIVFSLPFLALVISFFLALSDTAFGGESPRQERQGGYRQDDSRRGDRRDDRRGGNQREVHLDSSFFYGGYYDERSYVLYSEYSRGYSRLYSTSEFSTLNSYGSYSGGYTDVYPGSYDVDTRGGRPAPRGPWDIRDGRQGFGRNPSRANPPRQSPIYCYAQGPRGETFTACGYDVYEVQRQVLNSCRSYLRNCRPIGCNY